MRYLKHLGVISLLMLSAVFTPLMGQTNPHQKLSEAFTLRGAGEAEEAANEAKRLIDSGALSAVDNGRAWILMGLCREDQGRFAEAQYAYETAVSMLRLDRQAQRDYASAMDDLGHLFGAMGRLEEAVEMRKKAIAAFQEAGDRTGLARAYFNMASLDLDRKKTGDGKKHIAMALDEMAHGANLDNDDLAAGFSIRAQLALQQRDFKAAVDADERALTLWQRAHGENHRATGWGYVLLSWAYEETGRSEEALKVAREGIAILGQTAGIENPTYLHAEMIYAGLLDRAGDRAQASELRTAANQALQDLNRRQCVGCSVSALSFR